jgi:hypothetical protein
VLPINHRPEGNPSAGDYQVRVAAFIAPHNPVKRNLVSKALPDPQAIVYNHMVAVAGDQSLQYGSHD